MNRALPLLGLLLPVLAQAVTPDEAMLQQAVHEGRVRPFHEMMEVAARLPVRASAENTLSCLKVRAI